MLLRLTKTVDVGSHGQAANNGTRLTKTLGGAPESEPLLASARFWGQALNYRHQSRRIFFLRTPVPGNLRMDISYQTRSRPDTLIEQQNVFGRNHPAQKTQPLQLPTCLTTPSNRLAAQLEGVFLQQLEGWFLLFSLGFCKCVVTCVFSVDLFYTFCLKLTTGPPAA